MVRAAHSTGKPAYGVGPGNVPVYVDRIADLEKAARYIVASKAFDYSTICATEQAVIADQPIADRLAELMQAEGAYFTDPAADRSPAQDRLPPGWQPQHGRGRQIGRLRGRDGRFQIPAGTRILVTPLTKVGREEPLSHEKMTTVLGWYEADGWEQGCESSIALIQAGGRGHTQIIYANDEKVIMAFGLEKPVFRILVNTMGTLGAIGLTTGVMPSLTLGSGGVGGAITGDNVTAYHLINIKRLAYETVPPPAEAFSRGESPAGPAPEEIERLVRQVVNEILRQVMVSQAVYMRCEP